MLIMRSPFSFQALISRLAARNMMPAWKTAVAIGDIIKGVEEDEEDKDHLKNKLLTEIGKDKFNAQFRICPVVCYSLKTAVHSVYVRTSPVPVGMNAYDYFTENWRVTTTCCAGTLNFTTLYQGLDP
jgi:hypothetical protein